MSCLLGAVVLQIKERVLTARVAGEAFLDRIRLWLGATAKDDAEMRRKRPWERG